MNKELQQKIKKIESKIKEIQSTLTLWQQDLNNYTLTLEKLITQLNEIKNEIK